MTLDEFYEQDPRRKRSPEADYGVWWYERGRNFPPYRVSYIQATGEVYAVGLITRRVSVLGIVPPDEDHDFDGQPRTWGPVYYATLDRILEGWAEKCGKPGSLAWVRERLAA